MTFPKIDGYVVTEKLGSGSYSTVYKAYAKVGARMIVAIKCVDKSRIKNSGSAVDNLITEIRLLKTLTHPHIVHMKHFTWDDKNIYIIMEYCCGGDLSKYIHRYGKVPEKQVLFFLQQLASALKFMREKGVVHMDLKPHNLLLHKGSDGMYTLKVADFGFAQYMSTESTRSVRGSPLYMAPEMIRGDYDERVDLWSVGIIMYECPFGKAPYSSNTLKELVDKIQSQAPIVIPPHSSISPGCMDLLTRLLKHDPNERISYDDFFNHEYLDLEHMPSKENYEKAVSLMREAVSLDAGGRAAEALAAYRGALALLVPAAAAAPDRLRRAALQAKLARYMERAEEIKESLKQGKSGVPPSLPPLRPAAVQQTSCGGAATAACCGTAASANSYEFAQMSHACVSCRGVTLNGPSNMSCSCQNGAGARSTGGDRLTDAQPQEEKPQSSELAEPSRTEVRSRSPPRFGLKRLFGKQNSVPYLDQEDSNITDTTDKQKVADSENCRIA